MAQQQQDPDYYAYDRRVAAQAEASAQWASVFKLFLILVAAAGFVWVLWFAFGITGLQFSLIALFVVGCVVGIWLLMMAQHGRIAQLVTEIIENIVAFQRADDQGEVARTAIAAWGNAQKGGQQLDGRLLQVASMIGKAKAEGEIAAYEARQLVDGHRQQTAQTAQQTQEAQRQAFYGYASDTSAANAVNANEFHFHE
jgi:uncharacterized SAM-binding protein YcdF (DUF218 family)